MLHKPPAAIGVTLNGKSSYPVRPTVANKSIELRSVAEAKSGLFASFCGEGGGADIGIAC